MIEIQVESNITEFLGQLAALGPKCLEAQEKFLDVAAGRAQDMMTYLAPEQTGRLRDSISIESEPGTRVVGPTARSEDGFYYPYVVNYGRGPIFARRAHALRFVIGGQVIFRKSVGPARGTHFVENTARVIEPDYPKIAQQIIEEALKG